LQSLLDERHLRLEVTQDVREFLADQGYDPVYGARPLKRVIQRELQNPIALELLEGTYEGGDTIRAELTGGVVRFAAAGAAGAARAAGAVGAGDA
jgi:ATP-dependent Clp protease ATP-binding subunit ClpB